MENRREGAWPRPARHTGRGTLLALTFLLMLVAVAFSVLSARAILSWSQRLHDSSQRSAISRQQNHGGRKPADEALR